MSAMLLSRALDDKSFGAIALFMSIGQVFFFFVDSGYSIVLNRKLSLEPQALKQLLPPAMGTRLVLALFSLVTVTIAAAAFHMGMDRILVLGIILLAFSLEALAEVCFAVFRSMQRAGYESVSRILAGVIGLVFIATAVERAPGPGIASVSYLLRSALMAAACVLLLGRISGVRSPSFSVRPAVETLRENRYLWAMGMLMISATRLDSVVLRAFMSEEAVGAYQECYRIVDTLALIITPTLLPGSLFPALCRAFSAGEAEARRILARIASLVTGLALVAAPPLMVAGSGFLRLVWGSGYLRGQVPEAFDTCFTVCILAVPAVFWMNFLLASLLAAGRQKAALRGAAIGMSVNLGANLLLVPRMGLAGSALAMLGTNVLMVFLFIAGLTRIERSGLLREHWRILPGAAASAMVLAAGRHLPTGVLAVLVGAAQAAGWLPFSGLSLRPGRTQQVVP